MATQTCPSCAALLPLENRFCGQCGASVRSEATTRVLDTAPAMAPPTVTAAGSPRPGTLSRYTGPLWVGGIGSLLLLVGIGIGSVIVSAVQFDAAPGVLADLFGPLVEEQVAGTIAEDIIEVGGAGGSVFSTATLMAVVVSAVLSLVGLLMVVIAAAWAANRSRSGRRSGVVTIAAPAPPIHYERPAFSKPAPPTFQAAPPPQDLPRATFTTGPKPPARPD